MHNLQMIADYEIARTNWPSPNLNALPRCATISNKYSLIYIVSIAHIKNNVNYQITYIAGENAVCNK